MLDVLQAYPYLTYAASLLALAGASLAACPKPRRYMLGSGLLAAPLGLSCIHLIPEYWDPARVAVFVASPEDIASCFALGVLAWPAGTWVVRRRLALRFRLYRLIRPSAFYGLFVLLAYHACRWGGIRVADSSLLSMTALTILLVGLRPGLWRIPVSGALVFGLLYPLFLLGVFQAHPRFLTQWSLWRLSGILVFGVPLEEIAWALVFGALWPLWMAHVFDARLVTPADPKGEASCEAPPA